ncbi:Structural maintenance of chromosomes protein 3 [Orchesella cincta]|uniref:Structural maintenance of chromosomes protein 3 n=1 Tax=Orchesella cincta TaxID=48709 RepID=A0A1D2N3V0_ORCCI|nr:Structural maintenance of chromosomes protein 3 [Orchesella cincta]
MTVIIQGFKSYREQTVIEPFHKGHNVVVGRNGSGKSNFFYAIQFVLSDEFSHLRPEQRQALLHEGTGPRVLTGFVEIIFDNADGRFPIDRDEVFLRRVIGAKKDQYFLNKKMVPRNDVVNLLESAGFSRSNPYYIVKQGKINQMATAPDSHRLKLLREVAGTRVYDERKEESKSILKETEGKKEKIDEFLKTIEERLKTLEEEKEELKEYQKWDKKRRALEYTIHDRELNDTRKKLEELEARRKRSGQGSEALRSKLREAEKNAKQASRELKEIRQTVNQAKEEKQAIQLELQQLMQEKTKLENRERDLDEEMCGDKNSKKRAEQELDKLNATIKQKEEELRRVKPEYEELKKKEETITKELALKEQKRKELYAKQGRGSQFTTKDERDKWITGELKMLNKRIKDKIEDIDRLSKELDSDARKKIELEDDVERMSGEVESYKSSIDEYNKRYYELKKQRDQHHSERNELWRKESSLQQSLSLKNEEMNKCEGEFRSMAGREIFNGRNSVLQVLETFKNRNGYDHIVRGYHGLVLENIRCDEGTETAVEVTAGKRLYYHIVETDEIGSTILKEFNRQKLPGEVNFMPLNRLMVSNINYPKDPNVIEMVRVIKYEDKYDKSVRHIFGKTLICRELEAAVKTAKTHKFDCVTLDGDKVASKGVLTGGYYNTSRSSLEIQKRRGAVQTEKRNLESEMSDLKRELYAIEEKIKEIGAELQKNETKNSKIKIHLTKSKLTFV